MRPKSRVPLDTLGASLEAYRLPEEVLEVRQEGSCAQKQPGNPRDPQKQLRSALGSPREIRILSSSMLLAASEDQKSLKSARPAMVVPRKKPGRAQDEGFS